MSFEEALKMDQALNEPELESPPQIAAPQNNSMYVYATVTILPIVIVIIAILGIPVDKEKNGTALKIVSIFLLLVSLVGMYMYHRNIDVLSIFKSQQD
jgi:hypothetical protein